MTGTLDGLWRFILGIMAQPLLLRWVLWPFLAVILNLYWLLWVLRWLTGSSEPTPESKGPSTTPS